MRFTGYKGPYQDGMPTRRVADDGTVWREATPRELSEASSDLLVYFGKPGTDPVHVSTYDQYKLPGNYPFLVGIAQLLPVYVQDTSEEKERRTCLTTTHHSGTTPWASSAAPSNSATSRARSS